MKAAITFLLFTLVASTIASAADDMRIISCTVDFKVKDRMASIQTQSQEWLLPVQKGSVKLKSMEGVTVNLAKKLVNDQPQYRLQILEGKVSRGEISVSNHSFQYSAPLSTHVEDGEDGFDLQEIRVACDPGYAAG